VELRETLLLPLTDNGKEFTATGQRLPTSAHASIGGLCRHRIEHRLTRSRTPQTNGMIEPALPTSCAPTASTLPPPSRQPSNASSTCIITASPGKMVVLNG